MNSNITIAIDGHSSCGKSTLAKDLAKKLNYIYVDTGAMYRTVALFAKQNNLIENNTVTDIERLKEILDNLHISFRRNTVGELETLLNDTVVEKEIRSLAISNMVSQISAIDFVREKLVSLQQDMGKNKGIVMDGRDIGTVVFPDAELKIFLTASAQIRAQRRYDELEAKGETVDFNAVLENIVSRDHMDETRAISPLRKAYDAVTLDNSDITKEEQLNCILERVNQILK